MVNVMPQNRMRQIRQVIAGLAIGVALFVLLGFAYRIGRHSFAQTDAISVLGQRTACNWKNREALAGGYGLVVNTPLVSSAILGTGEPPNDASVVHISGNTKQFVSLRPERTVPLEAELASRSIVNRFGTELYSWRCAVIGDLDPEDNNYYLLVTATGGGDAGATVTFDVQHQSESEFTLTVVERLWSTATRECIVTFTIDKKGEITVTEESA